MNEESLSALLDGECTPEELDQLLRELDHNPELRQRFSRMRLAQEALKGSRIRSPHVDLASRVMAALPERPDAATATVTQIRKASALRWQPLAGLAAAAGVGALAVLALRPDSAPRLGVAEAPVPVAAVTPPDTEAVVALDEDEARMQQLRNYLIAYSQSRAQHGVGGTLGYARYAAYSDARDPAADR